MCHVPLLEGGAGGWDEAAPPALHADHLHLPFRLHGADRLPGEVVRDLPLDVQQGTAGEALFDVLLAVEEQEHDAGCRPPHRGDGGDVQSLVDLGAPGVVDPGDHLRDVVVLAGDPGRDDVRIVPVGDGHERIRLLDPRLLQHLAVEAEADDGFGLEARREPVERLWPLIDDGDGVAGFGQLHGESGTDPPAAHDQDVHGRSD